MNNTVTILYRRSKLTRIESDLSAISGLALTEAPNQLR